MRYTIDYTSSFKKQYKKVQRQNKNIEKLKHVVNKLANGEMLEEKYKDHSLFNDKSYYNCRECHIEPDCLLIYKYDNNELILLLLATGSHSELFSK